MAVITDRAVALNGRRVDGDGILRRVVQRFIEARSLEARRRAGEPLEVQDDAALKRLGFSDAEIACIREG